MLLYDRSKSYAWIIWFLAILFFAFQFILRVSPSIIVNDIINKFNINATSFSVMAAVYYFTYAAMQIPAGALLDKFGPRLIIPVFISMCIAGNLLFIYSNNWILALISRFLVGFGSAAGFVGAAKVIRTCFPERFFTHLMGLSFSLGLLGAIYGGKPISILNEKFGWQTVLINISIAGSILGLAIFVLFKKINYRNTNHTELTILGGILKILKNQQILLLGACGALLIGPMECFADMWGTSYLEKNYNLLTQDASFISSTIYIGMCFGGPLLAIIASKLRNNYLLTSICALIMSIIFIILISFNAMNYYILVTMMFIVGILSCYQVIVFTIVDQMVPATLSGIAISTTNMLIMAIGATFHFIIGIVMDIFWDGSISSDGLRIYDSTAYNYAMLVIPITLFLGFISFLIIKPKQTKS